MAFRPLRSFIPTADEVLRHDFSTLGKILLAHLKSYEGLNTVYQNGRLNRSYFLAMLENRNVGLGPLPKEPEYGDRQPEVTRALMEAWNWLEREGMLIRDPQQPAGWFSISRRGEELLKQNAYESGERSGLGLAAVDSAARGAQGQADDRRFEQLAIEEARKSAPEDERVHPKVGVVVVKNGRVVATAHRGEIPQCHAEYIALEKKLPEESLSGATVYTTLEPCTSRNHPKVPCAIRLTERKVARVLIGMLDPDDRISGRGLRLLRKADIDTGLFPADLMAEVEELNRDFIREKEAAQREGPGSEKRRAVLVLAIYERSAFLRHVRDRKPVGTYLHINASVENKGNRTSVISASSAEFVGRSKSFVPSREEVAHPEPILYG